MLLNNAQAGTHHPHAQVPVTQPQISTVLRLKASDVKGEAEARPLRRGEGGSKWDPQVSDLAANEISWPHPWK